MADKQTPFSLFVRQALLYPLASPFLPAEADVRDGVSYANSTKTGTLSAGAPGLTWQTDPVVSLNFFPALTYAEYLNADGVTVNEIPQNIWRLPFLGELCGAIMDTFFTNSSGLPGGFSTSVSYWANLLVGDYNAMSASGSTDMLNYVSSLMTENFDVRCVKI